MSHELPLVSIVCPAFEEEAVLPLFHAALIDVLEPLHGDYRFEIVYVDDGSRDGTLEVLRRLARQDARVRYLSLSRNFGHQAALSAGLDHARGDAVVSIDADLQHPPSLIPTLLDRWRQGHDVVLTLRADDHRLSWFKRATSAGFYRLLRRWSDLDVRVAASDYRLLSRNALDGLLAMPESHRFLRGMVQWLGFRVAEVPFCPDVRRAGVSKYTLAKMVRLAADGLFSFSRAPLRLAVGCGLAATALSFVGSVVMMLTAGGRPFDWALATITAGVHLVGGCVLGTCGVLGEYVGRVYEECKGRPIYVLKDASPAAGALERPAPQARTRRSSAA